VATVEIPKQDGPAERETVRTPETAQATADV
jgi:hypothetical protein